MGLLSTKPEISTTRTHARVRSPPPQSVCGERFALCGRHAHVSARPRKRERKREREREKERERERERETYRLGQTGEEESDDRRE